MGQRVQLTALLWPMSYCSLLSPFRPWKIAFNKLGKLMLFYIILFRIRVCYFGLFKDYYGIVVKSSYYQ